MLLPTISSRCQMIRFSPLSSDEIENHLVRNKIAKAGEARIRARVARGSLGRAVAQDFDEFSEQREAMLRVLQALSVNEDRIQLLRSAEELNEAKYKDEYESRLDILETLIRDAWMLSLGSPDQSIVNQDLLPQLKKIGAGLGSRDARTVTS